MTKSVIKVEQVSVSLGGRPILREVSLELKAGEILGIVGGSGSGKSVLLRTILGLTPRIAGDVSLLDSRLQDGETAWRKTQRRTGVLFQQGGLFSSLTVKENIEVPMRELYDLPGDLREEMARTKLSMVGLAHEDADKTPSELSGGMIKRAALARALALDPEIVFLDEPTSGLDPVAAGAFDDLILTLRKSLGFAVFMITHDIGSLKAICDHAALISHGEVIAIDTVPALIGSRVPEVAQFFNRRPRDAVPMPSVH